MPYVEFDKATIADHANVNTQNAEQRHYRRYSLKEELHNMITVEGTVKENDQSDQMAQVSTFSAATLTFLTFEVTSMLCIPYVVPLS